MPTATPKPPEGPATEGRATESPTTESSAAESPATEMSAPLSGGAPSRPEHPPQSAFLPPSAHPPRSTHPPQPAADAPATPATVPPAAVRAAADDGHPTHDHDPAPASHDPRTSPADPVTGRESVHLSDPDGVTSPRVDRLRSLARRLPRPAPLDWIRLALLAGGIACVLTGALPAAEAERNLARIAPLLVFLAAIIVLAKLTKEAQVFDVLAARMAITGRGSYPALFGLAVLLAASLTMFLNLDTTAVLLTPVLLALARQTGIAAVPLAMTTVWLANTASLLLPVSNLTNLLAADRVALPPAGFAARMWLPQAAALVATMAFLWLFYWRRSRRGAARYEAPAPPRVERPVLFWPASLACLGFVAALFAGVDIAAAAGAAAAIAVAAFAIGDRSKLRPSLIPWQLLIFVTGLFLVVPTLSRYGLGTAMTWLIGDDAGVAGSLRAAAAGAGLSNLLNNLPAYTAAEAVVPAGNHTQLLALLIGTNVGPIVTMWGSLATLLWYESCRIYDVRISKTRFAWTGTMCAVTAIAGAVFGLLLTG